MATQETRSSSFSSLSASAGVGVLFAGVLLGTSSGVVSAPQPLHAASASRFDRTPDLTTNTPAPDGPHAAQILTNAEMLAHVRDSSGLTWDQTARLFNVSRRSIHLWLAGGRMSAGNQQRLVDIVAVVDSLPAQTAEQRRNLLLQPGATGQSMFDSWRSASASSATDINRNLEPLADPEADVTT
ncbi:hypothetical protein [Kribbia dieselivorans]|uniref:hypothetical protein n=1 Tax=Kribbia dieselivorans TaxID=331526 RepID=UPI0012EDBFA4|nr:hypothetical protein [Kribbia dieselivorans]